MQGLGAAGGALALVVAALPAAVAAPAAGGGRTLEARPLAAGTGEARTTMRTPLVRGDTTDHDQVQVE